MVLSTCILVDCFQDSQMKTLNFAEEQFQESEFQEVWSKIPLGCELYSLCFLMEGEQEKG